MKPGGVFGGSVLAIVLAGTLAAAAQAQEAPTAQEQQLGADPNVTLTYYEVKGASYKEIRRQMEAHGPDDSAGKRWAGHAAASYQYSWPTRSDGTCDLSKAVVTYKINVVLPRLAPGTRLEGSTASWWRMARHNLEIHELDHVRLALGYAKDMETAIKSATCDTAKDAAQKTMAAMQAANAKYDAMTNHGTKLPNMRKAN